MIRNIQKKNDAWLIKAFKLSKLLLVCSRINEINQAPVNGSILDTIITVMLSVRFFFSFSFFYN